MSIEEKKHLKQAILATIFSLITFYIYKKYTITCNCKAQNLLYFALFFFFYISLFKLIFNKKKITFFNFYTAMFFSLVVILNNSLSQNIKLALLIPLITFILLDITTESFKTKKKTYLTTKNQVYEDVYREVKNLSDQNYCYTYVDDINFKTVTTTQRSSIKYNYEIKYKFRNSNSTLNVNIGFINNIITGINKKDILYYYIDCKNSLLTDISVIDVDENTDYITLIIGFSTKRKVSKLKEKYLNVMNSLGIFENILLASQQTQTYYNVDEILIKK